MLEITLEEFMGIGEMVMNLTEKYPEETKNPKAIMLVIHEPNHDGRIDLDVYRKTSNEFKT